MMTPAWVLGTIITIAMTVSVWLTKKSADSAKEAADSAKDAVDIAKRAMDMAADVQQDISVADKAAQKAECALMAVEKYEQLFFHYEKTAKQRHGELMTFLSELNKRIDNHVNGA